MSKAFLRQHTKTLSVLFVEDEKDAREMGGMVFGLLFDNVYLAKNGEDGLNIYREKKPDIIITDIQMPVMDGLTMIREIRKDDEAIPVIVTTAHSDDKYFIESIKLGIDRYILKPIVKDECVDTIFTVSKRLLDKKNAAEYEKRRIELEIHNAKQEALKEAMYIDRLTKLPNRFSLMELLGGIEISSLAVINIDRLKDINKIYGIKIGDKAILSIAQMLTEWCKNRHDFEIFCMGGDEFALYSAANSQSELETVAKEIIEKIENELFVVENLEITLSATVGIAYSSSRCIEDAETALKIAKQKKKSFFIYEERSLQDNNQTNNIVWYRKIKEALKTQNIVPFYQPIVDSISGEIVKYECLVRLIEHDGSIITPFHFLDIAKQTRLYVEITKAIIQESIKHSGEKGARLSINLSVEDMGNQDTAEAIINIVKESGIGDRITFEILEGEGIESFEEVSHFIERLKTIGCRFSIDDFGTGYSNFIYLLKLNVDYLKIDGSLIQKIPYDENVYKAVSTINSFAHSIGIKTIAEFVSDKTIYLKTKEIGIDYCQGYYFSQPLKNTI